LCATPSKFFEDSLAFVGFSYRRAAINEDFR
jgi:hypothetical protein